MTGVNSVTRVPALDGIRGIAIILVLVGHAVGQETGEHLAISGVTLFFVLSGYLITGRLASGQTRRRFYANRARRLLPAMVLMLVVTGPPALALGWVTTWQLVEASTYIRDISSTYFGSGGSAWGHMWSLAVEEQFYLLWPFAFALAHRRRVVVVAGVASFAGMVAALLADHQALAYYSPPTLVWTLCLGCWLALQGWAPRWPRWLSWAPLRWFGVRSYGMYLWHYPLLVWGGLVFGDAGRWWAVALGIGAAMLSWRYVEQPFMRRGRAPHPAGVDLIPSPV